MVIGWRIVVTFKYNYCLIRGNETTPTHLKDVERDTDEGYMPVTKRDGWIAKPVRIPGVVYLNVY